jgi:hypothetical protein
VVEVGARPLGLDDDAAAVVQDEAREPVPQREPVDERPEADALDDTGDAEAAALHAGIVPARVGKRQSVVVAPPPSRED